MAYDLTGTPLGKVDDLEQAFLAALRRAAGDEPVYVVSGGHHPVFDDEIRKLDIPVVVDPTVGDRAFILAGDPLEWRELHGHLAGCDERGGKPFCHPDCEHYDGWMERIG